MENSSWPSSSSASPSSSSSSPTQTDSRTVLQKLLTQDERKRLNDVRIESFLGALKGFIVGGVVGYAGYQVALHIPQLKGKIHKNHLIPSILVTGACCSYLLAVVNGQNSLLFVGDIFKKGPRVEEDPNSLQAPRLSSYQSHVVNNQRDIIHRFEESFHRRAEAIRNAKSQNTQQDNFTSHDPYATNTFKENNSDRDRGRSF